MQKLIDFKIDYFATCLHLASSGVTSLDMANQRTQVIQLYKTVNFVQFMTNWSRAMAKVFALQLQYLGREYPGGAEKFRQKCHDVFVRNRNETDPAKIATMIKQGEFVVKELEALYSLRKYRAMKRRYYDEDISPAEHKIEK